MLSRAKKTLISKLFHLDDGNVKTVSRHPTDELRNEKTHLITSTHQLGLLRFIATYTVTALLRILNTMVIR